VVVVADIALDKHLSLMTVVVEGFAVDVGNTFYYWKVGIKLNFTIY